MKQRQLPAVIAPRFLTTIIAARLLLLDVADSHDAKHVPYNAWLASLHPIQQRLYFGEQT